MELAHKLVSTRRGSLYIAVVAALVAGLAILVYLNRYRNNLQSGTTPVTVLIARQTIPKGTPGSVLAARHLFTATTIRESQLREGAFSDTASLRGRFATRGLHRAYIEVRRGGRWERLATRNLGRTFKISIDARIPAFHSAVVTLVRVVAPGLGRSRSVAARAHRHR
jgi:hypothetical protein